MGVGCLNPGQWLGIAGTLIRLQKCHEHLAPAGPWIACCKGLNWLVSEEDVISETERELPGSQGKDWVHNCHICGCSGRQQRPEGTKVWSLCGGSGCHLVVWGEGGGGWKWEQLLRHLCTKAVPAVPVGSLIMLLNISHHHASLHPFTQPPTH